MFTIENFAHGITNAVRNLNATIQDDVLVITKRGYDFETDQTFQKPFVKIPIEQFQTLLTEFEINSSVTIPVFTTKQYFETAVQSQHTNRSSPFHSTILKNFEIHEHNYQFTIEQASHRYLFALLCSFHNCPDKYDISPMRLFAEGIIVNLEDFFNIFRLYTVKIVSPQEHSISEFKRIFDAYMFNIAYNFNISLSICDFTCERISRRSRNWHDGQLFPYKKYKHDLTKYYQQAISSNLPFMQYLAFYHVAEFFFEKISEDESFQVIRDFITRPSFSPYSQEDIRSFYNTIRKKMRNQRDDGVWNEKNGLLLCLKQYVPDLSVLKDSIDRIDRCAIDYYQTTAVAFADDGKIIDFSEEAEKVYSAIRNRIYATRNAIVHSKEGEKLKYEPFKHDKQLAKELPLIRAVAEEIIINSADPINYNFTKQ